MEAVLLEDKPKNLFESEFYASTVFADRNLIAPHYTPNELPFREKQIEEIAKNLSLCIHNKRPDNFFLYGKTGTGKTSVTKNVISQLSEFVSQKNIQVRAEYINCRNHNSKYRVLIKLVKELYPTENFLGYSAAFVYEKVLDYAKKGNNLILVLDELDKVKDLDELIYGLTRGNDELQGKGGITLIGISNNLNFKERLDPRTKSSLCEQEMVFPPYNAEELRKILFTRAETAFKKNAVEESAINLAAAFAAQESGDARTAVMLLLRAGEISDKNKSFKVTDKEVIKAKQTVEEEIIFDMISTLPRQQQLVLLAISDLSLSNKGIKKLNGLHEEHVLFSGEVYEQYRVKAKSLQENIISSRWYRQYISELEMYGLIHTTSSGKGIKGQTRLIKLGYDAKKIKELIEKEVGG
ncbi:MAG: AAA family ATPase [Candidatus Diapherotrites archaeon]|nr:AAA family ATPase [Candidatus Diapherotrites archaeon]